jgi:hypothetical protein
MPYIMVRVPCHECGAPILTSAASPAAPDVAEAARAATCRSCYY